MYKSVARGNKKAHGYNFYHDIAKIKSALADATYGATNHAKDILSNSVDEVRDRSAAVQERVEGLVHERPIKTMGLALLAGVIFGYFLHR